MDIGQNKLENSPCKIGATAAALIKLNSGPAKQSHHSFLYEISPSLTRMVAPRAPISSERRLIFSRRAAIRCPSSCIAAARMKGSAMSAGSSRISAAISAAGIEDKRATFAIGTSAVIAVMTSEYSAVRGIHSQGYEPTAEKLHSLEAGVRAMGDLYDWFVKNCVPAEYERRAKESGMNIHAYLRSLAEKKKIGESRLIALDWFNGNRSVLPNDKLSGMILGLTLATRPEDIYRALIESTVFELRRVFDNYTGSGVEINSIVATGGIPLKDPMLMQILADTLNMPVSCLESTEATALGSAVYGATAAGLYGSVAEASQRMKQPVAKTYHPVAENTLAYAELYREYCKLYDYFAKGENKVMEYLHDLDV